MNKSVEERKRQVDKANNLSLSKQCKLLNINRSSLYYKNKDETDLNLELMREIDQKHLKHPWLGVPRMTVWLKKDKGYKINKKRVSRLFKLLDVTAIGPKPNTSKRGKGKNHKVYPYLLRDLKVNRINHVWACDITYIPVAGGYLYLFAIIDLHSRYVVGWSLSNTMTSKWCLDTLEEAISIHGKPEILNTDQGSQFTALEFSEWVTEPKQGIKLSMDGKGRAIDNIFIERLWRSVKYEHVYLYLAEDGKQCYRGLKEYFEYYNTERRHQSIGNETPLSTYKKPIKMVA